MINFLLDLLRLVYNVVPLFFAIAVFTLLAVLLSKSIKKHAVVYYWVLAIPFILTIVPFILRLVGIDGPRLNGIPVLSYFTRDYVHMATLGFPLLIIIMYMGALPTRYRWVARLMSIRKQLSIIVGFPVLTHGILRAFNTFPNGLKFFFAQDEYLAERPVNSLAGAYFSNFVFVLGIFMLVLFFILWITSFTGIQKRMGNVLWKKVQWWSYVLYAMLFVHSMGLQIGGILNAKAAPDAPRTEMVAQQAAPSHENAPQQRGEQARGIRGGNVDRSQAGNPRGGKEENAQPQSNAAAHGRSKQASLADIKIDRNVKRYIHVASVLLIFGSYLYLRIRKARSRRA